MRHESLKDWTSFLFCRAKLYPQTAGVKIKATIKEIYAKNPKWPFLQSKNICNFIFPAKIQDGCLKF